jgi:hypothetical protein
MLTRVYGTRACIGSVYYHVLAYRMSSFALPVSVAMADTELFTSNPGFETGTGNAATGWTLRVHSVLLLPPTLLQTVLRMFTRQ